MNPQIEPARSVNGNQHLWSQELGRRYGSLDNERGVPTDRRLHYSLHLNDICYIKGSYGIPFYRGLDEDLFCINDCHRSLRLSS